MKQQERPRNVGAIGITDCYWCCVTKIIDLAASGYEVRQFVSPEAKVLQVKYTLRQTPEETRHSVFQDLSSWAKYGRAWRERFR
jgi:hypothetical protein